MSDDQGPWAMRCAGTHELETPSLDRLASEGMMFRNCFCASPVCTPSRATFLTGRMPSAHGVHDWLRLGNIDVEDGVTEIGRDRSREYLDGIAGFTDYLAEAGYVCGLSGKWHLGASDTPQKGHKYWCAYALGGGQYCDYFIFDNDTSMTHQTRYVTDLVTDRSLEFLDRYGTGTDPFCLSVHYTSPHSPWIRDEQPEEIWQMYEKRVDSSLPVLPAHPWGGWETTDEERKRTIDGYFTTITAMDKNIARILEKLEEVGASEYTLVLFTSDNGYNVGHHGILGKGNGTFPVNMYEESVKVPFIARYPGTIPEAAVNDDLVSHYDVLPTILEMVGIESRDVSLPGRSIVSALKGQPGGHDAVVVFDEYGPVRMIREQRWKYVHRYPHGPHELYDLVNDPGESTNLVGDQSVANDLERLRLKLESWFAAYVDQALDGARLPVTGKGQIDYADGRNRGRSAFEQIEDGAKHV